jgi:hypothetical protein
MSCYSGSALTQEIESSLASLAFTPELIPPHVIFPNALLISKSSGESKLVKNELFASDIISIILDTYDLSIGESSMDCINKHSNFLLKPAEKDGTEMDDLPFLSHFADIRFVGIFFFNFF